MNSYKDYKIFISKRALKEIKSLPINIRQNHLKKIFQLRTDEIEALDIRKLQSVEDAYRIVAGDYRIVFKVFKDKIVIKIITDLHRKDVYKLIANLTTGLDLTKDLDLDVEKSKLLKN
jgi:mRNA interferase RelE/StbE